MTERTAKSPLGGNPYANPGLMASYDSMEGLPQWVDPVESAAEREARTPWQAAGHRAFEWLGAVLPGLALAVALAVVGTLGADWLGTRVLGFEKTPVSPILIAIVFGLLIRNTIGLPAVYEPGLALALKRILRVGVALLGIRLSFWAAGAIGLVALPIAFVCIGTALLFVTQVNRAFGLPGRLGILVAVGTAICGNTAIVATAPVIGAKDDEVSYAVGCVTVFGLIALVAYPYLAHTVFAGDSQSAGFFLGTAIHDTAQVAGAGLVYLQQFGTDEALNTATVTKLIRNLFMLGVIPLVAFWHHRAERTGGSVATLRFREAVPLFVFGFLAMTLLRAGGDYAVARGALLDESAWRAFIAACGDLANACLVVAMASVGLGTSLRRLRDLGLAPLAVGLVAAVLLGGVSYAMVRAVAPWAP